MKNPLLVIVALDGEELTAHLRHQASGIYHVEWWHHGVHFHKSTKCRDIPGARTAAGLIVKRAAGQRLDPGRGQVMLGAAIHAYIADRWPDPPAGHRHSRGTKNRLDKFAEVAGAELNLAALDYDQAVALTQRIIATRRKAVGATSLVNDKNALSAFFNWLLRTRDETTGAPKVPWRFNPAQSKELRLEKSDARLKPAIPAGELQRFIRAARTRVCTGPKKDHRRRRLIWRSVLLCLGCGARPIEAARVKWSDINLDAGEITLFGKKRARTIGMSEWMLGYVTKMKKGKKPNAYVVAGGLTRQDEMTDDEIIEANTENQSRRLRRLRSAQSLNEICTLQALRRTAAKTAAPKMTPQEYSEYFGHSIAVAVKHYIGYGLFRTAGAQNVLDFSPRPKPNHTKNHTTEKEKTA